VHVGAVVTAGEDTLPLGDGTWIVRTGVGEAGSVIVGCATGWVVQPVTKMASVATGIQANAFMTVQRAR
jgi:hypothetical protein